MTLFSIDACLSARHFRTALAPEVERVECVFRITDDV